MNILCVSDKIDSLVYSHNAKNFFPDVDLILCAGDLPFEYIDFIVSTFNKPTYFVFGNHNLKDFHRYHKTIVAFPENDDCIRHVSHGAVYAGFKNIRAKEFSVAHPVTGKKTPLLISGVSGSIKYNRGVNQYTNREMFFHLLKMSPGLLWNKLRYGRAVDIFLTHAPPKGIHDKEDLCHRGFDCFLWFMKKFKPSYHVHGHIHIYDNRAIRMTAFESTVVVNAFSHQLIKFTIDRQEKNSEKI